MGIDASTNSIAFCIFYNKRPIHWGKIELDGSSIYDRIGDANKKIAVLYRTYTVDYVAIESSVFVKSMQVAIKLAYVYGSIIGVLRAQGAEVIDVAPTSWQAHLGNKPLTPYQKGMVQQEFPGKSKTWYAGKYREIRKQRTMDFFNKKWAMNLTDNDVGDACGIAYFAYWKLTTRS